MTKHALLNNVEHADLKIITEKSTQYGNDQMFSVVFPFEFKHVQANYPIFFHKDKNTGEFNALAMFGFEEGENLFLSDNGWDANYIPLMIERHPFTIGIQTNVEDGEEVVSHVINIDLNSPRVSKTEGKSLFLTHGGNSEYLNKISSMLKALSDNKETNKLFTQCLIDHKLLEPFNLDIQLKDGSNNRMTGFYTINEEKLFALESDVVHHLNSSGLLMLIYMVVASQSQIRALIERKSNLSV